MSNKIIGVTKVVRCLTLPCKDGGFQSVALEMDIWGFGDTAKEAESDLNELVSAHIEFATGRKEPYLLDHPTDKKWFNIWEELISLKSKKIKKYLTVSGDKIPLGDNSRNFEFKRAVS